MAKHYKLWFMNLWRNRCLYRFICMPPIVFHQNVSELFRIHFIGCHVFASRTEVCVLESNRIAFSIQAKQKLLFIGNNQFSVHDLIHFPNNVYARIVCWNSDDRIEYSHLHEWCDTCDHFFVFAKISDANVVRKTKHVWKWPNYRVKIPFNFKQNSQAWPAKSCTRGCLRVFSCGSKPFLRR